MATAVQTPSETILTLPKASQFLRVSENELLAAAARGEVPGR